MNAFQRQVWTEDRAQPALWTMQPNSSNSWVINWKASSPTNLGVTHACQEGTATIRAEADQPQGRATETEIDQAPHTEADQEHNQTPVWKRSRPLLGTRAELQVQLNGLLQNPSGSDSTTQLLPLQGTILLHEMWHQPQDRQLSEIQVHLRQDLQFLWKRHTPGERVQAEEIQHGEQTEALQHWRGSEEHKKLDAVPTQPEVEAPIQSDINRPDIVNCTPHPAVNDCQTNEPIISDFSNDDNDQLNTTEATPSDNIKCSCVTDKCHCKASSTEATAPTPAPTKSKAQDHPKGKGLQPNSSTQTQSEICKCQNCTQDYSSDNVNLPNCPKECMCKSETMDTIRLENPLKKHNFDKHQQRHPLKFPIPRVRPENTFKGEDLPDFQTIKEICQEHDQGPKGGQAKLTTNLQECNIIQSQVTSDLPHLKVKFHQQNTHYTSTVLLDTGATTSFMNTRVFHELFENTPVRVVYQEITIRTATGTKTLTAGKAILTVQFSENCYQPI